MSGTLAATFVVSPSNHRPYDEFFARPPIMDTADGNGSLRKLDTALLFGYTRLLTSIEMLP